MKFICFGSGSSGNCYYLESRGTAILIDLGIGIRAFKRYMSNYGLTIPKIAAIIVTHDHTDHIKAVGPMAITYRTPVYASQRVHEGIDRNRFMTKKIPAELRELTELNTPFEVGNFRITPFAVPHDSSDNNGYFIELIQAEPEEDKIFGSLFGSVDTAPISIGEPPKNIGDSQKNVGDFPKNVRDFSKNVGDFSENVGENSQDAPTALPTFCLITDAGQFTDDMIPYVKRAKYLIIEANYDTDMLANGPYPKYLQDRISSGRGHLANVLTAAALRTHLTPVTQRIWLCHLSAENNHPDTAAATVREAIATLPFEAKPTVEVLRRTVPSELMELR